MSCGDVPWKPWHGTRAFERESFRVCFRAPSDEFRALVARWEDTFARAARLSNWTGAG